MQNKHQRKKKIRWRDFLVELRLTIIRRRKTAANLIYRFFLSLSLSLHLLCMRFHRIISFKQFLSTLTQWLRSLFAVFSSFFSLCRRYFKAKKVCRQPPLIAHLEFMNALKQSHSDCIIVNQFTPVPRGFSHITLQTSAKDTIHIKPSAARFDSASFSECIIYSIAQQLLGIFGYV